MQSGVIGSHAQPAVHSVAVTSSSSQAVAQQHHATVGEEVNGCIAGGDANMTSPSDKHSTASALTAPQTKVALVCLFDIAVLHAFTMMLVIWYVSSISNSVESSFLSQLQCIDFCQQGYMDSRVLLQQNP